MDHGQKKALHPFFSKPNGHGIPHAVTTQPIQVNTPDRQTDPLNTQSDHPGKRRKLSHDAVPLEDHLPFSKTVIQGSEDLPLSKTLVQGSEDLLVPLSSPAQLPSSQPQSHLSSQPEDAPASPDSTTLSNPASGHTFNINPSQDTTTTNVADVMPQEPPKKMMQLKSTGRLASPVNTKSIHDPNPTAKPAKRGRKKKEKHLIVVYRYDPNDAIGHTIQRILDGSHTYKPPSLIVKLPVKFIPPALRSTQQLVNKPAHPFFSAKPKLNPMPPPPQSTSLTDATKSPRRSSAVTPGKLRAQRHQQRLDAADDDDNAPSHTLNQDRLISKQPGMSHAPWPSKGISHVRGDFIYHAGHQSTTPASSLLDAMARKVPGKMKHKTTDLSSDLSLLQHYQNSLEFDLPQNMRLDGFHNPPSSIRLPTRHLLTGSEIQSRVDLHTNHPSGIHPACAALHQSIPGLTPYDQGRSEPQIWSQKYAPQSSETVLQTGPEVFILRDWIRALTISSTTNTSSFTKASKGDRTQPKKRRKKAKGLEGFIVDSDDDMSEAYDMEELPALGSISSQHSQNRPSLVRPSGANQKVANAVIISGPSGCGKSAMVYAVAKELGFEVFEINSGSRRTGKDVLDRVGDMVENHLVQRHSAETGNTSADEDAGRLSDAFNKDLQSGRQGTMAKFFNSQPKAAPAVKKRKQVPEPVQAKQQTLSKARPARAQKQSLILLEEVDILFDEDKGFWQTVITLMLNSRRPVIMTCNDEDLVPVHTMTLHALLRLQPPPVELSAMYLELIAAKEGHILSRDDLLTLYASTRGDLRASIANMQIWCQMGIGDPRGGLSWIFQRWPQGSGVSEDGQPLRVVSEGSLQSGMGLFQHQREPSLDNSSTEELLQQVWSNWNVDPRLSLFTKSGSNIDANMPYHDRASRMKALVNHGNLLETMSDMDSFACVGLPSADLLDTTDPELSDRYRGNFIIGMPLLQTPTLLDHQSMGTRLAVSSAHLASRVYGHDLDVTTPSLIHAITAKNTSQPLTRATFSHALEPLAYQCAVNNFSNAPNMTYTSLDGPFKPIALDIAPYVRSIAAYDQALESQRARLGGAGGSETESAGPKKMRTTRAARSALEGGQRALTRRDRWFGEAELDLDGVLKTGGRGWPRFATEWT